MLSCFFCHISICIPVYTQSSKMHVRSDGLHTMKAGLERHHPVALKYCAHSIVHVNVLTVSCLRRARLAPRDDSSSTLIDQRPFDFQDEQIMPTEFQEDSTCFMKKKGNEQGDSRSDAALWEAAEKSNNCNFRSVKRHLASASIFYSFLMIQGSNGPKVMGVHCWVFFCC